MKDKVRTRGATKNFFKSKIFKILKIRKSKMKKKDFRKSRIVQNRKYNI